MGEVLERSVILNLASSQVRDRTAAGTRGEVRGAGTVGADSALLFATLMVTTSRQVPRAGFAAAQDDTDEGGSTRH